jgi:molecular chaperone GrpE
MSGDTTDPRDEQNGNPEDGPNADGPGKDEAAKGESGGLDELQALADEASDLRDRLLRTMAEMENLRRRTEREKADTAKYAVSNFARDVLTVGDNLHRVIEHVPAEAAANDPALKSFLEGVELTERELLNMLERHGVKKIDPVGQRFDPNNHQAMYEVPNAEVPEGTVVDVMQAGYTIGDRCLRPALVAVAKGGAKAAAQPKAANDDEPGGDGEEAGH